MRVGDWAFLEVLVEIKRPIHQWFYVLHKHKSLLHVQNVTNESVQYDLAKSITSETIASMNDKGQDYKSTSLRVYLASNASWYREAVSAEHGGNTRVSFQNFNPYYWYVNSVCYDVTTNWGGFKTVARFQ